MADNLSHHLRNMKRRLKNTQTPTSTSNMSQLEKVDMLENALSTFRSEVNMKLEIMQQILTTRNEQVSVQKKLLDREQNLYNVLLGHWMNSPKLAASGLSMNFSTEVQASLDDFDYENEENLSDPDYTSGDDLSAGPSRKKSKSSLRRQRKSGRNIPKHNKTQNVETTDPLGHEKNPNATDDGSDTADQPGNQLEIQMKCEYDDEDNRAGRIDFDFVGQSDFPDQSEIEVATGSQNTGVQDNPNSSSLNLTGLSTTPDNDAHTWTFSDHTRTSSTMLDPVYQRVHSSPSGTEQLEVLPGPANTEISYWNSSSDTTKEATELPRILDGTFFEVVSVHSKIQGMKIRAKCRFCVPHKVLEGYKHPSSNFISHLKRTHPERYQEYLSHKIKVRKEKRKKPSVLL